MCYTQQDQTIYYIWVRSEISELVDFIWFFFSFLVIAYRTPKIIHPKSFIYYV